MFSALHHRQNSRRLNHSSHLLQPSQSPRHRHRLSIQATATAFFIQATATASFKPPPLSFILACVLKVLAFNCMFCCSTTAFFTESPPSSATVDRCMFLGALYSCFMCSPCWFVREAFGLRFVVTSLICFWYFKIGEMISPLGVGSSLPITLNSVWEGCLQAEDSSSGTALLGANATVEVLVRWFLKILVVLPVSAGLFRVDALSLLKSQSSVGAVVVVLDSTCCSLVMLFAFSLLLFMVFVLGRALFVLQELGSFLYKGSGLSGF